MRRIAGEIPQITEAEMAIADRGHATPCYFRVLILHGMKRLSASIIIGLSFGACCLPQTTTKGHRKEPLQIVFDNGQGSQYNTAKDFAVDIYTMDRYGGHVKRLTSDHRSHNPSWSPDGREIVFLQNARFPKHKGDSDSPEAIYSLLVDRNVVRMGANGSNPSPVAPVGPDAQEVVWFPDAQYLGVRMSDRKNLQVYFGTKTSSGDQFAKPITFEEFLHEFPPSNTRHRRLLLTEFFPPVDNFMPAFYATWNGPYLMSADPFQRMGFFAPDLNAYQKIITLNGTPSALPAPAFDATWSPDKKYVAYSKFSSNGHSRLYVAQLQNGMPENPTAVTEENLDAHEPAWSADGSRLAFSGLWKNSSQIFIIGRDGANLIQLSHDPKISCGHASWSPDTKWIVAGCGSNKFFVGLSPFGNLYQYSLSLVDDIYLFNPAQPASKPKNLTECGKDESTITYLALGPHCRAQNPSFAPLVLDAPQPTG